MLLELALKGSGAATFESFYGYDMGWDLYIFKETKAKYRFAFVTDHDEGRKASPDQCMAVLQQSTILEFVFPILSLGSLLPYLDEPKHRVLLLIFSRALNVKISSSLISPNLFFKFKT